MRIHNAIEHFFVWLIVIPGTIAISSVLFSGSILIIIAMGFLTTAIVLSTVRYFKGRGEEERKGKMQTSQKRAVEKYYEQTN